VWATDQRRQDSLNVKDHCTRSTHRPGDRRTEVRGPQNRDLNVRGLRVDNINE